MGAYLRSVDETHLPSPAAPHATPRTVTSRWECISDLQTPIKTRPLGMMSLRLLYEPRVGSYRQMGICEYGRGTSEYIMCADGCLQIVQALACAYLASLCTLAPMSEVASPLFPHIVSTVSGMYTRE